MKLYVINTYAAENVTKHLEERDEKLEGREPVKANRAYVCDVLFEKWAHALALIPVH